MAQRQRRVSKRRRPRPKRKQFLSLKAALGYARANKWAVTQTITHTRGVRVQVVTPKGPRTLRVVSGADG